MCLKYNRHNIALLLISVICLCSFKEVFSQEDTLSQIEGTVVDNNDKAISYASIMLKELERGTIADEKGKFIIKSIPLGKYTIKIHSLGFTEITKQILIRKGENIQFFILNPKSYNLKHVDVTAKRSNQDVGTSYDIKMEAIEHEQVTNLNDIMTLMPGGQTFSKDLVNGTRRRISIRSEQQEDDKPSFGTAVEVDGIRLSNNSTFLKKKDSNGIGSCNNSIPFRSARGVDARIVATDNIEIIKVTTGIPSVEYGDLTSGIIRVKTKSGVMPFSIKSSSTPKQKHASISKGLLLGKNAGVLNINYDFTQSNSDIASPYTNYIRNAYTIKHKKVFFINQGLPFTISSILAGNFGGFNSKADPDEFKDSYTKQNAINVRGGINIKWQLNTKLLSFINLSTNVNYSNNKYERYYYDSKASSKLAFHGTKEGYFVGKKYNANHDLSDIQILEQGHWSQTEYDDSKPINYSAKLKLGKKIITTNISNNIKFGINFFGSGNMGKGVYYENREYTPSWREHRYCKEPYLNNLAIYIEEQFLYKFSNKQSIILTAGLRNDHSIVKDSRYKNVNSISPRFNVRHNIIEHVSSNDFIQSLSWYAGWGQSVKLPSFGMLYTRPVYHNRLAFVTSTLADGTTYEAYYIEPNIILANKNLKWQKSRQFEVGLQARIKGIALSLSYFNTLGLDRYIMQHKYIPFTYYLTTPHQLSGVSIPYEDRSYTIDNNGTVTVHDKKGVLPNEILEKKEKRSFRSASYTDNGSPVNRQGIEWVIDFGKIQAIQTSVRLDGKYYFYKSVNNRIISSSLGDNQLMSNGQHYQYIGYYYGSSGDANGIQSKRLTANAIFVTHIPKLRLIFSLKIEGTLMDIDQNLSEMPNGNRSFTINKIGQTISENDNSNIYNGNSFAAMYPLYYTSFDDMNTKISFKEKYIWAYHNDKVLFNDLSKMVETTNRAYYFSKNSVSPYFSANINVSKEIGEHLKLSFYAINMFNTMAKVSRKRENIQLSLLNSGLITAFSYGMSIKIKI